MCGYMLAMYAILAAKVPASNIYMVASIFTRTSECRKASGYISDGIRAAIYASFARKSVAMRAHTSTDVCTPTIRRTDGTVPWEFAERDKHLARTTLCRSPAWTLDVSPSLHDIYGPQMRACVRLIDQFINKSTHSCCNRAVYSFQAVHSWWWYLSNIIDNLFRYYV